MPLSREDAQEDLREARYGTPDVELFRAALHVIEVWRGGPRLYDASEWHAALDALERIVKP